MTPEEKAKEIIQKFRIYANSYIGEDGETINNYLVSKHVAKQCAAIHVQGIIDEWEKVGGYNAEAEDDDGIACSPLYRKEYGQQVLSFINK